MHYLKLNPLKYEFIIQVEDLLGTLKHQHGIEADKKKKGNHESTTSLK